LLWSNSIFLHNIMQPLSIVIRPATGVTEYGLISVRIVRMMRKSFISRLVLWSKEGWRKARMSMRKRIPAILPIFSHLNQSRWRKPMVVGVAAALAGSGVGMFANGVIWLVARESIYQNVDEVPEKEVAIVLGAKVNEDGSPSPVLADRLHAAELLYKRGKIKKIIVTGDHMAREYNEPLAMLQFLTQRGIPASDVFMDHAGFRTFDSMVRARRVFGVTDAVVCTQRFHLGRSVYLARQFGIDAVGLESDFRRYRHHSINLAREFIARTFALLDVHLLGTEPTHLGPPIHLSQDARITHDPAISP
jgi:SanA protein